MCAYERKKRTEGTREIKKERTREGEKRNMVEVQRKEKERCTWMNAIK